MKIFCTSCNEEKLFDEFYNHPNGKHGKNSKCKSCFSLYFASQYRVKSVEKIAAVKKYKARSPRNLLAKARKRALERRPTENPISTAELYKLWQDQNGCCPISGYKLTWGRGKITETSLSLDRIDHELGYCSGNVRLVCYAINAFRGRMTDNEMLSMAKSIVSNMEPLQTEWKHREVSYMIPLSRCA